MILLDTNVLVAAARTADTNHVAAARLLEALDEPLMVPRTVGGGLLPPTSGVDPAPRSGFSATFDPAGCNWQS